MVMTGGWFIDCYTNIRHQPKEQPDGWMRWMANWVAGHIFALFYIYHWIILRDNLKRKPWFVCCLFKVLFNKSKEYREVVNLEYGKEMDIWTNDDKW